MQRLTLGNILSNFYIKTPFHQLADKYLYKISKDSAPHVMEIDIKVQTWMYKSNRS